MMKNSAEIVAENVHRVRDQIETAARKSGRTDNDVTLVAVTKYVDAQVTTFAAEAGCSALGESRPQQLWDKADLLAEFQRQNGFKWHLIGHLQRNKVARTLPIVRLFHSIDSERLIAEIDKHASVRQPASVLLEVNISNDPTKHGWRAEDMPKVLESLGGYEHVRVLGLMAMAGLDGSASDARREFAEMMRLKDQLTSVCPPNCQMTELSMGMSRDFEIAIEEGATMVRVGSTLFAGLAGSD